MSEIDLLIQELRDTIDNQKEEIDRLNKLLDETRLSELHKEYVITELEKYCEQQMNISRDLRENQYCLGRYDSNQDTLDKLKELKENK